MYSLQILRRKGCTLTPFQPPPRRNDAQGTQPLSYVHFQLQKRETEKVHRLFSRRLPTGGRLRNGGENSEASTRSFRPPPSFPPPAVLTALSSFVIDERERARYRFVPCSRGGCLEFLGVWCTGSVLSRNGTKSLIVIAS